MGGSWANVSYFMVSVYVRLDNLQALAICISIHGHFISCETFVVKHWNISQRCIMIYELVHEISNNVVCATSKCSDQPAHMRSLIRAFACRLNIL